MTRAVVLTLLLSVPLAGHGQQPQETFQACLSDHTSGRDRKELARWIFLAIANHPEMRDHLAANSAAAWDESSRRVASLIVRLLSEDCVKETKVVIRGQEVSKSFELAFARLGALAMQELMADKAVATAMGDFERHLDKKKLEEALIGK